MRRSSVSEFIMLPLLKLLQDGRFHSGEELGAAMGVSRSAIWKQLQCLEAETGLPVHKVRGKGYRLANPLILLDEQVLRAQSAEGSWPISVLRSVDSTNAEALRRLLAREAPPFVLLAERQTAGRGRRGRSWISPFGENLYYSLVLRVDGGMRQLEGLSLVVGVALLHALRSAGLEAVGLKWPNDLLLNGRKIAGVLLELSGDPADVCHVVIGVGVNVNMLASGQHEIDQPWTSMRAELGRYFDRNELVRQLNGQLSRYLAKHFEFGFSAIKDEWQANHLWQGRDVVLHTGATPIEGKVLGVDSSGAICLRVAGVEQRFSGGELGLRLRDDS